MRKFLLILILIISGIFCVYLIINGLKIGNMNLIKSYDEVATISAEKKQIISDLKQRNGAEFVSKNTALISAVQAYNNKKSQYEKLVADGEIKEENEYVAMDIYDIDFLWTNIGLYATQNNVTLQFDVSKSATATTISTEYVMCDLNFTVTGDYIPITDFIYNIEKDDKLNFQISNFVMEKGGENLQATFVVKEVPINSETLISVPSTAVSGYTEITTGN